MLGTSGNLLKTARRVVPPCGEGKTARANGGEITFACAAYRRMEKALLKRITLNPDVCFGRPTIRNLRYPFEMLLDSLGAAKSMSPYP